MWRFGIVLLPACMMGAGPVVAYRTTGQVAVGYDLSSTIYSVGPQAGNTFAYHGPTLGYIAARGVAPVAPHNWWETDYQYGIGGSLGWGRGDGKSGGMAALWPEYVHGEHNGCTKRTIYTFAMGVRRIARHTEIFASPAVVSYSGGLCD